MTDPTLIARCLREEPKAQYELYKLLYPLMMSVCTRYERNRQDAVSKMNEGFLKILTQLDKRRPEVPFELWVRKIMINTVIDHHRRNVQRMNHERLQEIPEANITDEVNDYLVQMEAEEFAEMLDSLPEMSSRVFNLFAIDGYAHSEIATLLGISEGTSRWHVSHARSILQSAIAREARKSTIATR